MSPHIFTHIIPFITNLRLCALHTIYNFRDFEFCVHIGEISFKKKKKKKKSNFHQFSRNILNNSIIRNKYIIKISKYAKCRNMRYILLRFIFIEKSETALHNPFNIYYHYFNFYSI
jgi:hypothetical protein